jgi:hypothetical protein
VAPGAPDAARTQISALTLSAAGDRVVTVNVLAADSFGNPTSSGDAASLSCYARCLPDCPMPGTPGTVAPAPGGGPGAFVASVALPALGISATRFELHVLFGGVDVGSSTLRPSPLTVSAPPPITDPAASFAFGDGLLAARAGQPAIVGVQLVDRTGEYLQALSPGEALAAAISPAVLEPLPFVPAVSQTASGYRVLYKIFKVRTDYSHDDARR